DHRFPVAAHQDVCRLHVAMDNALGVSVLDATARLQEQRDPATPIQLLRVSVLMDRLSIYKPHRQVGRLIHLPSIEHGGGVWVVELRGKLRLAREPLPALSGGGSKADEQL